MSLDPCWICDGTKTLTIQGGDDRVHESPCIGCNGTGWGSQKYTAIEQHKAARAMEAAVNAFERAIEKFQGDIRQFRRTLP